MMQIVNHINQLLFRYECIIIPGFGAFLTHHQAAYVDKQTGSFMPPKKNLSFNRQLQTNDGLLANHLAMTYGISYFEAVQELREEVQIWTAQIENHTPLYFSELGVLQSNKDGGWQFTPDPDNIFQAASFGLSPVQAEVLPQEVLSTPAQKVIPIVKPEAQRKEFSFLKFGAAAATVAILLGGGGFAFYKQDTQDYNLAQQKIAEKQLQNQIHTASFTIANPLPAITLALPKEQQPYHLVAGAFREKENADKRVLQLIEQGYDARILRENAYGLHEVIYSSFTSKRDATNALHKIQREDNNKAWLLVDTE